MKIYIVGPVGSGKTTFAKRMSDKTGIPYFELDSVRFGAGSSECILNVKREDDELNKIFNVIIDGENWIIEDVGRPCFEEGLKRANLIILLDMNTGLIMFRIFKRWLKQILNIEKSNYKPNILNLCKMYKWLFNYKYGKDGLKERLLHYKYKICVLYSKRSIEDYINNQRNVRRQ